MQINKVIELKCFGVGVKGEDGFTLISDDDEGDALAEAFAKARAEA